MKFSIIKCWERRYEKNNQCDFTFPDSTNDFLWPGLYSIVLHFDSTPSAIIFPHFITRHFFPLTAVSSWNVHYFYVIFFSSQWSISPLPFSIQSCNLGLRWLKSARQRHLFWEWWDSSCPCTFDLLSIWMFPQEIQGPNKGAELQDKGKAICGGRECAILPASQGSESQQIVLNGNTWSPDGRPQASILGKR